MRIRLVCLSFVLVGLMVSSTGCLAIAVGAGAAGTVAYLAGDVEVEEPYSIDEVYAATRQAVDELDLHVIPGDTDKDALSATVVARDAADKRITIRLKTKTSKTTKLSIRVGTFGDETKSHLIYSKIVERLEAAPQVPEEPVQTVSKSPVQE